MTQQYYFGAAKWVGRENAEQDSFSVLRGHFELRTYRRIELNVLGLGFFKCYINGICINPDTFLPLSSDYEDSCDPPDERLSGHRVYVPQFDITPYVREGDNIIAIHYGGGWYTHKRRCFGSPKVIYRIAAEDLDGDIEYFVSDESCRIGDSYVTNYTFVDRETHCYHRYTPCFDAELDDSLWQNAVEARALNTEYCTTSCPADALISSLSVTRLGNSENGVIYDCGRNTTGYPVLRLNGKAGDRVTVTFSEALTPDGRLDLTHNHNQCYDVICDGDTRISQPEFTWFGFRYFEISGEAEPLSVSELHADIKITSDFDCDDPTLKWIYDTFIHTMLCNMHTGHPSDCPHLERRGYTGDGQLTCNAALTVMDGRAFYEKWLQDIVDCQDELSGHIQYTAPYIRSGGGPGGWGSAIVEVPYQLYLHYGDTEPLCRCYKNMRRYIDFLETHSEFGLVTSDKKGAWCLGDWCGPIILYSERDISDHNQQILIPAPMVNTYFMVKSLEKMKLIAKIIGRDQDIDEYEAKIAERKRAIQGAYLNTFDHNFVLNAQGANAYAVDIGLGTERTYDNLKSYYEKLGHLDTGIFATDILIRVLFERGDGALAADLLRADGTHGYERWRQNGATTFHEYWDSNRSRSHNHPMFGSPVAYIFEYLLGIKQHENTAGYREVTIAPQAVECFGRMSGGIMTPKGRISVGYERCEGRVIFTVNVPGDVSADFKYLDMSVVLTEGENIIEYSKKG